MDHGSSSHLLQSFSPILSSASDPPRAVSRRHSEAPQIPSPILPEKKRKDMNEGTKEMPQNKNQSVPLARGPLFLNRLLGRQGALVQIRLHLPSLIRRRVLQRVSPLVSRSIPYPADCESSPAIGSVSVWIRMCYLIAPLSVMFRT